MSNAFRRITPFGHCMFSNIVESYPLRCIPFCFRRKQRAARLQDSQRQELIDRAEPEEEGGHGGGHDELPMGEVMMYQVFIYLSIY